MDYSNIIKEQRAFFKTQQTKDVTFRIKQLKKFKKALQTSEDMLYDAIYKDFGKSRFETFITELGLVYNEIDYYIKNIKKLSKPKWVASNIVSLPSSNYVISEPLGCSLVIGAWNYPYQLSLAPVVSSIAAGNTTILKPSEIASHTAQAMEDVINSNFDKKYFTVIQGGIPETTELLNLKYDKIFFTGSPKVGKIIYQAAAKHLTPVTLELGGKSPVIVTPSANLSVAAKRLVWGKFINAGQTCIAPDYLFLHKDVKEEFIKKVSDIIAASNYTHGSENFTRIINERNFDRLASMIDEESVIFGGKRDKENLTIEPTLLSVDFDHKSMEDEIFGPILPIITYSDYNEVINYVLDNEKPLAAYLFSNSKKEKERFTKELSFGGGCINDTLMHISNDNLPFGGVGNSGIGKYHGKYGFLEFSNQKALLKRNVNLPEPNTKYPKYSSSKFNLLKRALRMR